MNFFKKILLPLLLFPSVAGAQGWTITHEGDIKSGSTPTLANGQLGATVGEMPFEIERILSADSYLRATPGNVSRILNVINPLGLSFTVNGEVPTATDIKRSLDLRHASLTTQFDTPKVKVEYTLRALRNMPYALMLESVVEALDDTSVEFSNHHELPRELTDTFSSDGTVWCEDGGIKVIKSGGSYNRSRNDMAATSLFITDSIFNEEGNGRIKASLKKGDTANFTLIGTVITSDAFADVWNESERQAIYARKEGPEKLRAGHEKAWDVLWKGDIEISGDSLLQPIVRNALYNIYSSIREDSGQSIAPMGLTSQHYNGHIFWDAEMWIFPALLVLNPSLAREMIDYRYDRLEPARRRAAAHGYEGAMFPWESDDLGEESTPTFALTGPLEHHITADIAIAAWNYYRVTGDTVWLRQKGYPLIKECADFWVSRATDNDDGTYSIKNVVGADEYAIGVDDNAFTNASASLALEYAGKAASVLGLKADPRWEVVSHALVIPMFEDGVTREHAAYSGEMIKQADVNLLGYPLELADERQQLADMDYYINKIDSINGPAMSHAVMAIQQARMGNVEKADELFALSYKPYIQDSFLGFAETPTKRHSYFMTGAGGMLQALIYGFGGYKITDNGLVKEETSIPAEWESLTITIPD